MAAYYNEIDPYAADWLRNLISAGVIAPGDVDQRDVRDVTPGDLAGYTQCHFFAGIGVWSYALRRAGWPDDRQVWTGSCPCQPFSAAGKGEGFDDERHLWPYWHHLIRICRPGNVFGEQVASKDGLNWLDLVHADMEGEGYAFGAQDRCSAGVGAPHIRQRLYFAGTLADGLADAARQQQHRSGHARPAGWEQHPNGSPTGRLDDDDDEGLEGLAGHGDGAPGRPLETGSVASTGSDGGLAVPDDTERGPDRATWNLIDGPDAGRPEDAGHLGPGGGCGGLADANVSGLCSGQRNDPSARHRHPATPTSGNGGLADHAGGGRGEERPDARGLAGGDRTQGLAAGSSSSSNLRPGPTNGFWGAADWLFCRDGKWRPVRPGAQQMVDGSTGSLGPLRAEEIASVEVSVDQWAQRHQRDATEAVRNLWDLLSKEEDEQRPDGGFDSVREAPFLLAFLRQLTDQGWRFPIGDERTSSEASRRAVRVLRYDEQPCYSSRQRGLDEQLEGEPADPLRLLSQILAHHTEVCWGQSGWQNVGSFPLVKGAIDRVGRLRAYGNAIDAENASDFISTFLESEAEGHVDTLCTRRLMDDLVG